MWYQGSNKAGWSIGYAVSTDGITWTRESSPQITPTSYGEANVLEVVEPMVLKNGSIYQMWFKETIGNPVNKNRIRYAESPDGISWSVYPEPVLETPENDTWDALGPTNPSVLFDGHMYHMWYVSAGAGSWKIGYASSSDGKHWSKSGNNPLNVPMLDFVGAVTVKRIDNLFQMWYHVGQAGKNVSIYHAVANAPDQKQWSCVESCEVFGRGQSAFDSQDVTAPDILVFPDRYLMWYTGNNGSNWQIGLATYNVPVSPTPTPVDQKNPIIIIPGFMASWNKDAILHDQPTRQSDWKATPFTHEYEGIIRTLENIGYQARQDYFVFYYDWRKGAETLAYDLKDFIQESSISARQFSLIGHSYGGLIGRIYAQKYPDPHFQKLVTVGSPHQGTALTYKPVEAGELDKSNSLLWLAEKSLLQIYKDGIKTDKQIIEEKLPAARDLFPSFDFLKTVDNRTIFIHDMRIQNPVLQKYSVGFSGIFPNLQTVAGEKHDTLFGYSVNPRSLIDQILDLYPDGRPVDMTFRIGDYTIISDSAKAGNDPVIFPYNHGEIMYEKDAVKSILHAVGIDPQDGQIASGSATVITPSLIFYMLSPARMEVTHNGITYPEQDGMIFIPNAAPDSYTLSVIGLDNGPYKVIAGQIGTEKDSWSTIHGTITASLPDSQIDTYTINFNEQLPSLILTSTESLDELILYLSNLNETVNNTNITYAITTLRQTSGLYVQNQLQKLKSFLLLAHSYLLASYDASAQPNKNSVLTALEKLERLYQHSLASYTPGTDRISIQQQLSAYNTRYSSVNNSLLMKKNQGYDFVNGLFLIEETNRRMESAESEIADQDFTAGEILLKTNEALIKGLKKL